ncbi:MAG: hypothetical protein QME52_04975 [Bacteroidota bacterium]|nr:hypothetical protein [Bacteroidota bacterium]
MYINSKSNNGRIVLFKIALVFFIAILLLAESGFELAHDHRADTKVHDNCAACIFHIVLGSTVITTSTAMHVPVTSLLQYTDINENPLSPSTTNRYSSRAPPSI